MKKKLNYRSIIGPCRPWTILKVQGVDISIFAVFLFLILLSGCKKAIDIANQDLQPRINKTSSLSSGTSVVGNEFTIAIIPDTQFYVTTTNNTPPNHYLDFFSSQTQWIVNNRVAENVVYAIHLGDVSENGDQYTAPWLRIDTAMKILDNANMPYGVAVGNHDQGNSIPTRGYLSSSTTKYNQYFGIAKFTGKPWYGGNYGSNNDSHYDLFSAGGLDFIVIYLEYDAEHLEDNVAQNTWAYNLLVANSTRKGIIVTHYLGNADSHGTAPNAFSAQGGPLYNRIKSLPNVFMMLGGHVNGEGYRIDTYNGNTIKSFISDYQFRAEGGGGYMRLMKFSPDKDLVSISTYSPKKNLYETDANSQFTVPLFKHEKSARTYDFDQDGVSELAFFNAGTWKVSGSSNVVYGQAGDATIPADYNGDGRTDKAVYRPSTREFYIIGQSAVAHGNTGDIPVPADYNGDGKADITVWRPSNGTWYVRNGSTTAFGQNGDIPIPGDYDGNGFVQPAVYRPSNRTFYILGGGSFTYGNSGDIPVVGDYNGDGKTEAVLYRPSTGYWYNYNSGTSVQWGGSAGDIPAPADYDGDGDTDIAYYRAGILYVYGGSNITLGGTGDKIVNLSYPVRSYYFP